MEEAHDREIATLRVLVDEERSRAQEGYAARDGLAAEV